jgi:hypothetical protein
LSYPVNRKRLRPNEATQLCSSKLSQQSQQRLRQWQFLLLYQPHSSQSLHPPLRLL